MENWKKAVADSQAGAAPAATGGPARVTNDAEYSALPSGTEFIGPDGQTRRKPQMGWQDAPVVAKGGGWADAPVVGGKPPPQAPGDPTAPNRLPPTRPNSGTGPLTAGPAR